MSPRSSEVLAHRSDAAAQPIRVMRFRCYSDGAAPAEYAVSAPAVAGAGLATVIRMAAPESNARWPRFEPARLLRLDRGRPGPIPAA